MVFIAVLSGALCVAGEHIPQEVFVFALAADMVVGNNRQVHLPKPKHSAQPHQNRDPRDFNCPRKQKKNHSIDHRHGYSHVRYVSQKK